MIFCGIPGSGKTTIARLVAKGLGSGVHVQTDAVRSMIAIPSYTWDESGFVYESMFLVGREALKRGYDVILDATFLKEDHRQEARKRLSRHYSWAAVVCVVCDLETARKRNASRDAVVPEDSFTRLSGSFEKPRRAIMVDSEKTDPESAASYILDRIRAR